MLLLYIHVKVWTYQTCAGRPIQTQILCYLCSVHPSWNWYPWVSPRQMSRCPLSQVEQWEAPPTCRTPSAVGKTHPILEEKREVALRLWIYFLWF